MIKRDDVRYLYEQLLDGDRVSQGRKKIIINWCNSLGITPPNEQKQCRNCWIDKVAEIWRKLRKSEREQDFSIERLKKYVYKKQHATRVDGVTISDKSGLPVKMWLSRQHPQMFKNLFFIENEND